VSETFEGIGPISVSSGVISPVGPGQVINFLNEHNCRNVVFAFLSLKFWDFRLLHFERQCCLCWDIGLNGLIIVLVVVIVVVPVGVNDDVVIVDVELHVSCWVCHPFSERMFTAAFVKS